MPVLKAAKGLYTFSNELNDVQGALDVADNVVIDADDTIQSRRGFGEFGNSFGTASDIHKQLLVYKDRILRHFNSTIQFDSTGDGSFLNFDGTFNEVESGVRIKFQESNSNLYFTTSDGIKKISARTSADFTDDSGFITNAGIARALDVVATPVYTPGGFLPPQSKCAYRVVWGIRDNNNNLLLGSPSSRSILTNSSRDILTPETFELEFTSNSVSDYDGSVDDRFVLFSSLNTDYFLWFKTVTNPTQPQAPEIVGRTPIEVNIEGLTTSADIALATASAIITGAAGFYTASVAGSTVRATSTEEGENLSDASSSAALSSVVTTILDQGNISGGQSANASLSITVPEDINNTNYFYQIYRTAPITTTDAISLDDLDPGDEMNLAFEANITDSEIIAGEVIVSDITTETFRASGSFLYTNPNTGEGILQANDRPPIAKDIELFRNSIFYANTKSSHRLTINLLSVSAFTSGISDLIIGNSNTVTEYTFVGEQEVSEITTDSFVNTDDTGYILINSANDNTEYYVWFDKGSTTDPELSGKIGIRVEILSGDTDTDVANKLVSALNLNADFSAQATGAVVEVTNANNGNTTDISIGSPLTNNWAVTVITQGDGEDASLNEVLLSNQASAALAIDETARSLVNVINKDNASPVNAFYLSGEDDLPGIILLEAKQLTDNNFYIATSDTNITDQFNPALPLTETITAISADNPTQITSSGHGLITGDSIFIYNTDSTPTLQGNYTVTVLDANTFTVSVNVLSLGTTGIWFKSTVSSDNEEARNRLYYSKLRQPEAVPITNFLDIGPKDKAILRILALRDNLFVLKEDGVYIVTGTTAPDFGARLLDGSTEVDAPDSAVVLNNRIFALTSQGVVTISEGGVSIISRNIEDKILEVTNSRFNYENTSFGVAYESDRSYILWLPTTTLDNVATQAYRYNLFTRTWTRWTNGATCGIVNPGNDILYLGPIDRNFTDQERKNNDRTDYADRDFTLSISSNSVINERVTLSDVTELKAGDVLVQTQYLTIPTFNRLLKRLDIDTGLDDKDYESTLRALPGDDLTNKMNDLNTKLVADDGSGTITSTTYSNDFETLQSEYNELIVELNDPATDTIIKNYKQSEGTIPYEAIIVKVNNKTSSVELNAELPYLVGPIQAFKGIPNKIQWAPQHFGASDILKQVREGTFLFDQNNFYSGSVSYSSDLSANFEEIEFLARGVGFWGGNVWGTSTWGGEGNEVPVRTLIPKDKQRSRHVKVVYEHINAREIYRMIGISLEPRPISRRAYR
jgi:hypothetical protein